MGEVVPENDELSLDPKAIQLKDDLIALAAATRRGVSRQIMLSRITSISVIIPTCEYKTFRRFYV